MSKFINLIEKAAPIVIQSKPMIEIINIINEHLDDMCVLHPGANEELMNEIYMIANGPYFDLDIANKAVAAMYNEDGTLGQKLSLNDTNQIASSMSIYFDKFNQYDWYYTLNMIYSDYSVVLSNNSSMLNEMAKAFLMDKDAPAGKAYLYYKAMC